MVCSHVARKEEYGFRKILSMGNSQTEDEMQSERPRVLSYIQRPVSAIATPLH